MQDRNMKLHREKMEEFEITNNKPLMAYAREYAKEEQLNSKTVMSLNHVRLYKRIFLPCELIGQNGKEQTSAYRNDNEKGQIKWTFYYYDVELPSRQAFRQWNKFKKWLSTKRIITIFDFDEDAIWNWRL